MAHFSSPIVVEQRRFGKLIQLQLKAPELAGGARPGQFVLLRATPAGFHDPFLSRACFIAGADPAAQTIALVLGANEPDLRWLAQRRPGDRVTAFGPAGTAFAEVDTGRNLLLIGSGAALPALLFLASRAIERRAAVELIAAADDQELLPPPYLLPPDAGYQASGAGAQLLGSMLNPSLIGWADHIAISAPRDMLPTLSAAIQRDRLHWSRGFAEVALGGPMPCATGACRTCLVPTRSGLRTRCHDGPVFDLRDLRF